MAFGDDDLNLNAGLESSTDQVRRIARSQNIPDDVADDYLKVANVESGRNISVRPSPKGALGYGQVMPDTRGGHVRTINGTQYDLRDPEQNITAGLTYFNQGGSDPVGRRLHYFGGPRASGFYSRTGQIPNISDGNMTAAQYVRATGGQQPQKASQPTTVDGIDLSGGFEEPSPQPQPDKSAATGGMSGIRKRLTPKTSVTLGEGAEEVAPIKFQPADLADEGVNRMARGVIGMSTPELPQGHPDVLGKRLEAKFNHQPTAAEVNDALLEQMGKGYGAVGQKFQAETGANLVQNAAIEQQPDGSWIAHAKPSQGFVDALNAYSRGGLAAYNEALNTQDKSRIEANNAQAKKEKELAANAPSALDYLDPQRLAMNPAVQEDVKNSLKRASASGAQLAQNAANIAAITNPNDPF